MASSFARLAVAAWILLSSARASADEPADARGEGPVSVELDCNFSYLGQLVSGDPMPGSVAYALRVGLRKGRWDVFAQGEHGFWRDDEGVDDLSVQTMNVGLGVGLGYFGGKMRAVVAAGASVLLTESQLDPPGTTGFFVDLRPAGFCWRLGRVAAVELHPLTFALVVPTLSGIPLVYLAYRTALTAKVRF